MDATPDQMQREIQSLRLQLWEERQRADIMQRIATAQNKRANGLRARLRRLAPSIVLMEDADNVEMEAM